MKKSVNVFKKSGLFLLLALALLLLVRCEKDPLVVVPVKYTVDISAGVGGTVDPSGKIEVIKGKELNITFTSNLGYKIDTVFVNGVEFPLTNNVYPFVASSDSSKVEGVFKKTLSWDVMQVTWKLDSTYTHKQDSAWFYYPIWGVLGDPILGVLPEMQKTIKFLPNGKTAVTIDGDSTFWDGYWRIDESKTPPEIHFAGDAAALKGAIYVLEGDLKNRLVLARYNSHSPFIVDSTEKGDYKYVYTPLIK